MKENCYIYYKLVGWGRSELAQEFELKISREITSLHHFLFALFSLGEFLEYQIWRGSVLCATAQVCGRIFIFGFMPKKYHVIHIGPCWTNPEFRRRGLYNFLLNKICDDYPDEEKYIFAHKSNVASNNGILKAGGVPFAEGYKSRFGIYKIATTF